MLLWFVELLDIVDEPGQGAMGFDPIMEQISRVSSSATRPILVPDLTYEQPT